MRKILEDQRIVARDQNKVFVELATQAVGSPQDVVDRYMLKRGKGNAYVEFDIEDPELQSQPNKLTGQLEYWIQGDVSLEDRDPQGFENR